ncbi:MAG: phosphoglycolate phosphatase [Nitrospirales bacterium]|nr:MAG: phosphoglycolate phosphatase [Nitrospirales bacterium]
MMKEEFDGRQVELVLFDLDGTLIDSKVDIANSVNFTLEDLSLPQRTREEIFGFVGDGVKQLLRLSVGEGNVSRYEEALRIFRLHYLEHCLDNTEFYPNITDVLSHLNGRHCAVVTNKTLEYTLQIIQGLGAAGTFAAIESPRDSSELKPDPGMLLRVLEAFDVSPEKTLMIGDSTNDVRAAQASGVKVCAVGYGYGNQDKVKALRPDFYCETPKDLLTMIVGRS